MNRVLRAAPFAIAALAACGDRPDTYDKAVGDVRPFGLDGKVALVDPSARRVVLLTPGADQALERASVGIGKGVTFAQASSDGKRLFVVSAGDVPRRRDTDERPSLTVIEATGASQHFDLEAPHAGASIDPFGRYLALFAAPSPSGATAASATPFVDNPNEIVVVDLQEGTVTPRTLRSFGGRPQRISFTPELGLPGGQRRLLVVETDQDLALLDLDNLRAKPERPVITVRLTSGASTKALSPAAVVFDDGDPKKSDDARIGVRIANDTNVFTLTLVPNTNGKPEDPSEVPNDFRPEVNLTDVGGIPGDIAFVRTEAGLRLAAVVPGKQTAVLLDPATSVSTTVALPGAYSRLSLITSEVGATSGADVALLYGAGLAQGVAFWSLGRAVGQSYRSLEVVPLSAGIESVLDVPPPRPELKVLQASGANAFFVLNLATRTAAPLTTTVHPAIHVAPDGQRLWVFEQGTSVGNLAQVSLGDLHPMPLPLDRPIAAAFDIARAGGGRSLVALDLRGATGATVLDAEHPDTATARSFYGLLLEGLR